MNSPASKPEVDYLQFVEQLSLYKQEYRSLKTFFLNSNNVENYKTLYVLYKKGADLIWEGLNHHSHFDLVSYLTGMGIIHQTNSLLDDQIRTEEQKKTFIS